MHLYSLATDYQHFHRERNSQGKENTCSPSHINIFNDKSLCKNDITNLTSVQSYQIVGFKELKSMEDKLRKGKKNTFKKDTFFRDDRPFSKQSSHHTQTDLMTKGELLESLPHIHQATLSNSNKPDLSKSRTYRTEQSGLEQDYARSQMKTLHQSMQESKFSLSRIKVSMEQKNQEWKKLMARMNRDNYRFPSILKSSDLYRSKIEDKIKNQKTEEMANLNSQRWPEILRKDISLRDIVRNKMIVQTVKGNILTSRGTSKLRSQQEWLKQKQDEGYLFKKYGDKLKRTGRKNDGAS